MFSIKDSVELTLYYGKPDVNRMLLRTEKMSLWQSSEKVMKIVACFRRMISEDRSWSGFGE